MNKLSLFLLFLAFCAFVTCTQPPPGPSGPSDGNTEAPPAPLPAEENASLDVMMVASVEEEASLATSDPYWYCDFEFHANGKPYYYESLDYDETEAYRARISRKVDNMISEVYWSGDRCNCWVVLYQDQYFQGTNLGFWASSQEGSYDLGQYTTYNWDYFSWQSWATTVSSYSIYCY